MADINLNAATYEQIVTLLTQLHTSYSNIASVFYDVFYNPIPQNVTFEMFDGEGTLRQFTVKNLALSNEYRKIGEGSPEGNESGEKGTIYQDLYNGELYIKQSESGNENWSRLVNKALLDGYIMHGNVNPNGVIEEGERTGVVSAPPGTLYIDQDEAILYIRLNSPDSEGPWLVISANTEGFATRTELEELEAVVDGKESLSNKVNSIDNTSTDDQYPSAKCVYDRVNNKQEKNLVTSLSASSTDAQYPSAKCVYDNVKNKQEKNLVTSLSAFSTNNQYPSAKCVYDALQTVKHEVGEIVTSTIPLINAGLHPIDGEQLDGDGSLADFVTYMANLYDNTEKLYAYHGGSTLQGGVTTLYTKTRTLTPGMPVYDVKGNLTSIHLTSYSEGGTYKISEDGSYIIRKVTSGGLVWNQSLNYSAEYNETTGDFCSIYSWENSISNYGSCDKYVYNPTENTLRLPKRTSEHGQLVSSHQDGNRWYRIYQDGWCEQGGREVPGVDANLYNIYFVRNFRAGEEPKVVANSQFNTEAGYSPNTSNCSNRNANLWGCTIGKPTTTGFIVNRVAASWQIDWSACGYTDIIDYQFNPIYEYIAVANTVKTPIEADIDKIETDLNNKVDKSDLEEVQCVVETYNSGFSWYRIWSNGWCEQGGMTPASSSATKVVTLLQPYRDIYYNVLFGCMYTGTTNANPCIQSTTKTPSSFVVCDSTNTSFYSHWYTCGYIV